MMQNRKSVKWLLSGRVQGVGFRWFVLKRANELGILGWARNLPDGRVEVVGEAEQPDLDRFEQSLKQGPTFARVDDVQKNDYPHQLDNAKAFQIK